MDYALLIRQALFLHAHTKDPLYRSAVRVLAELHEPPTALEEQVVAYVLSGVDAYLTLYPDGGNKMPHDNTEST